MKYILTEERHPDYEAYRIVAAESNASLGINQGDLGGFIEKKSNLSEDGNAWVFPECVVLGTSEVSGNAVIKGGIVLKDVVVGLNSSVSVPISGAIFNSDVKIYGRQSSIVIFDARLTYRSITANKFKEDGEVMIGYSTFLGTIDGFRDYITSGAVSEEDRDLFKTYIPVIESRFK